VSCMSKRKCRRVFHLRCALACKCALMEATNKAVLGKSARTTSGESATNLLQHPHDLYTVSLCHEHVTASVLDKNGTLSSSSLTMQWRPHQPLRSALIEANQDANYSALLLSQQRSDKTVRSGAVTVLNIGRVRPDRPRFHTDRYVYPCQYRAARIYWSMLRPATRALYTFEILSENDLVQQIFGDQSKLGYIRRQLELEKMEIAQEAKDMSSKPSSSQLDAKLEGGALDLLFIDPANNHNISNGSTSSSNSATGNTSNVLLDRPLFRVTAMDEPTRPMFARSVNTVFQRIRRRVMACNHARWNMSSSITTRTSSLSVAVAVTDVAAVSYGHTAHQFFGLGLPFVRKAIEYIPDTLSITISLNRESKTVLYSPVFRLPSKRDAIQLHKKNIQNQVRESTLTSVNGCARADAFGLKEERIAVGGGRRVRGILAKTTDANAASTNKSNTNSKEQLNQFELKENEEENQRENALLCWRYQQLSSAYLQDPYAKLDVRKSGIHGWGLFAKVNFERNDMIIEYIGQKIRRVVADRRELQYEEEGVGSCYLFRLDKENIIDATRRGGMARFINHCCEPNAYARVISTSAAAAGAASGSSSMASSSAAQVGGIDEIKDEEKHIIIFAARDIQEGEEVMYDYKFPIEDSKLKCTCGAASCGGFMN